MELASFQDAESKSLPLQRKSRLSPRAKCKLPYQLERLEETYVEFVVQAADRTAVLPPPPSMYQYELLVQLPQHVEQRKQEISLPLLVPCRTEERWKVQVKEVEILSEPSPPEVKAQPLEIEDAVQRLRWCPKGKRKRNIRHLPIVPHERQPLPHTIQLQAKKENIERQRELETRLVDMPQIVRWRDGFRIRR